MRVSRIHRLLRLITLLQAGSSLSVDELARELEVSRRTVFRDLNMLEMAHIPYYFDRERNGYRITGHFFLPPVNLDLTEALSLMLLTVRRRTSTPLPWSEHAHRAAMKLTSALPEPMREQLGLLVEHLEIRPTPSARHEGLDATLAELAEAISQRRVCRMAYISFYERKQLRMTVQPLRLLFVQRAWYLLAWSAKARHVRTLKLGRIKNLLVTDKRFDRPDESLIREHFGNAWCMIPEGKCYTIHLHFDKQVAGNVAEVQWHPSQQTAFRDDGSLDFRVRVDGLGEITWWILGYGDKVRVVSPAALARKVRSVAKRVVGLYC